MYWASAGKSLTAFALGLAFEQGFIHIDDPVSQYLGPGWTSCEANEEGKISIRNQLSMTSGLDPGVQDPDCTLPSCLTCLSPPGEVWNYHNAPYTLLEAVLDSATGRPINQFLQSNLFTTTGMSGLFIRNGFNNVFWSKALSMARFGLLMLNDGKWADQIIMNDTAYFNAMIRPSQTMNPAYGFLWWLNGQSAFMVPGLQFRFPGLLFPPAPMDMYAALGKNGQILNVVPSMNLVLVRMGEQANSSPVGITLNNAIWERMNVIIESSTRTVEKTDLNDPELSVFPNPSSDGEIFIKSNFSITNCRVSNLKGNLMNEFSLSDSNSMNLAHLPSGIYLIEIRDEMGKTHLRKWVKTR